MFGVGVQTVTEGSAGPGGQVAAAAFNEIANSDRAISSGTVRRRGTAL